MKLAVTGATGRMGRTVIRTAAERGDEVVVAVARTPDAEAVAGVRIAPAATFAGLLDRHEADALIDFTAPESSVERVRACADRGVPAVVGTTGFDEAGEAALRAAGERVPVLLGANFSRGVRALLDAVTAAVRALPGYDVEVTETHHRGKRDAPSGTARLLGERIAAEREVTDHAHGREGDAPRAAGELGVHARRAGDVVGEHEVLLAGNHEVLSLSHRADRRAVFAAGALDAAGWLVDQEPGFYRFADVAGGFD